MDRWINIAIINQKNFLIFFVNRQIEKCIITNNDVIPLQFYEVEKRKMLALYNITIHLFYIFHKHVHEYNVKP